MAHFYGSLNGGAATRCGHKSTGIDASVRGWDIGCNSSVDHLDGKDTVDVRVTTGSNGAGHSLWLGTFTRDGIAPPAPAFGPLADLVGAAADALDWVDANADAPDTGEGQQANAVADALRAALAAFGGGK